MTILLLWWLCLTQMGRVLVPSRLLPVLVLTMYLGELVLLGVWVWQLERSILGSLARSSRR